jgi:hypothetical protein
MTTNSDLFNSIDASVKGKNHQSTKISAGFKIVTERKSSIKAVIIEDDSNSVS